MRGLSLFCCTTCWILRRGIEHTKGEFMEFIVVFRLGLPLPLPPLLLPAFDIPHVFRSSMACAFSTPVYYY